MVELDAEELAGWAREACSRLRPGRGRRPDPDVVLFYLCRWCQKKQRKPRGSAPSPAEARVTALRIAENLADHGELVDRIVAGDRAAVDEARRHVLISTRSRAGNAAEWYADEALQKVALILLTGTPPSGAAAQLAEGVDGSANEYVFTAPFLMWAQSVAISLVVDDQRRYAREVVVDEETFRADTPEEAASELEDRVQVFARSLRAAFEALPSLLRAVDALPRKQRDVMILTLCRRHLDKAVRGHLHALAPALFAGCKDGALDSDEDIARRLSAKAKKRVRVGTVRQNRSVGRRKLAARDARWALLLDVLMPHSGPGGGDRADGKDG